MDITITLTNREAWVLNKIATDNNMTAEEYLHSLVRSYLISKIQAYYQDLFKTKTIPELIALFGEPEW